MLGLKVLIRDKKGNLISNPSFASMNNPSVRVKWEIGKWKRVRHPLLTEVCLYGFHMYFGEDFSAFPYSCCLLKNAVSVVLALVEGKGKTVESIRGKVWKAAFSSMRIISIIKEVPIEALAIPPSAELEKLAKEALENANRKSI